MTTTTLFTDVVFPDYEVRKANEKRLHKIADEHLGFCYICARPVDSRKTAWVHMSTNGGLFPANSNEKYEWEGGTSQGWFEIGPECAKQVPAQYRKSAKEFANS